MASIAKRPNGQYRARYRDAARKEHSRHFKRKVDAQRWLDSVTTSVNTGTYVDPGRARTPVKDVASAWATANLDWKPTTRATNEGLLRLHVLPRWGKVPVGEVRAEDVQEWVRELGESGLSANSVRRVYFVFTGVMKHAVRLQMLPAVPIVGISLPTPEASSEEDHEGGVLERRYLTALQVEQLAEAAGEGRLVVLTLAYTGLRWGELAALRVKDFNRLRSRLSVSRSVTEIDGRLVWGTPKNRKRRTVPVPAFLRDELVKVVEGRSPEDLLFPAPRGGVLRNRAARRAWFDPAVAQVGPDGFTPHMLRHTAASLAVHSGANVLTVQRMLGHRKPSITLDVYSDLFDGDLDEVAGRLDTVRTGAVADYLRTLDGSEGLRRVN